MFGDKKNKPTTRLRELKGSDFEIAKGQPDIRGWDVRNADGRKFGVVHDLIFDIRAKKVRYMVINIFDTKELELEKRTVLVPIGLAELDSADNDVTLPQVTPFQLRALPRYDRSSLGAKVERDISTVFGRTFTTSGEVEGDVDESFYDHEYFDEDKMYRRRNRITETDRESLRMEAEREVPVSDDRLYNSDGTERIETDAEYFERTGRRRRG